MTKKDDRAGSNTTPPDILYHYTSQEGLLGIINNKLLWATHISYLNDLTENEYLFKFIKEIYEEKTKHIRDPLLQEALNVKTFKFETFIFSLSEDGDLLSQWRGYCPNNGGFSIGFNSQSLKKIVRKNGFDLVKCIYDEQEQKNIINRIFDNTIKLAEMYRESQSAGFKNIQRVEKIKNNLLLTDYEISHEQYFFERLNLSIRVQVGTEASKCKHPKFGEEKEWRLFRTRQEPPLVTCFKPGKSMLIPYLELKLADNETDQLDWPTAPLIDEIIVGPTPNMGLSLESVESFVRAKSTCQNFKPSSIPYRGW